MIKPTQLNIISPIQFLDYFADLLDPPIESAESRFYDIIDGRITWASPHLTVVRPSDLLFALEELSSANVDALKTRLQDLATTTGGARVAF